MSNGFGEMLVIYLIILILLVLITQPWFGILTFGLATLTSFFSMIASIIHFQIFGALCFFILKIILGWITLFIIYESSLN